MAITINGSSVTSNKLNGSDITEENLNGVKVYPSDPTANPSILSAACQTIGGEKYIVFQVRNNDDAAAEINYGDSSSVPLSAGIINPGEQTSQLDMGPYSGLGSATIYVRATASGKLPSTIITQSVSYRLCKAEVE